MDLNMKTQYPLNYSYCWHCTTNTLHCPKCNANECGVCCREPKEDGTCPMQDWWEWTDFAHKKYKISNDPTFEEVQKHVDYLICNIDVESIVVPYIEWVDWRNTKYIIEKLQYSIQLPSWKECIQNWQNKMPKWSTALQKQYDQSVQYASQNEEWWQNHVKMVVDHAPHDV